MKLTKYHKAAIVNSVLNDMPAPNRNALREQAQLGLVSAMSPAVQSIYAINPKALAKESFYSEYGFGYGIVLIVGDADTKTVLKPYVEAEAARTNVKEKLESALAGINTRNQFVNTFPEFSHYAPDEPGVTSNLPAVANLIADLVKAGWVQKVSQA